MILTSVAVALGPSRFAQEKPVALKDGKLLTVTHGTSKTAPL